MIGDIASVFSRKWRPFVVIVCLIALVASGAGITLSSLRNADASVNERVGRVESDVRDLKAWRESDHDILMKTSQQVSDMHEWLKPMKP